MNDYDEEAFRLGSNAGNVFVNNVSDLIREFVSRYQASIPGFEDEFYVEGFLKTVRNDLDIETIIKDVIGNTDAI